MKRKAPLRESALPDWEKVKKAYPKAYRCFHQKLQAADLPNPFKHRFYEFDIRCISGIVKFIFDLFKLRSSATYLRKNRWGCFIEQYEVSLPQHHSRYEADQWLFYKLFELLEQRLTNTYVSHLSCPYEAALNTIAEEPVSHTL